MPHFALEFNDFLFDIGHTESGHHYISFSLYQNEFNSNTILESQTVIWSKLLLHPYLFNLTLKH